MTAYNNQVDAIITFIKTDKFGPKAWDERGLKPSDDKMCTYLQDAFNDIAEELKTAIIANKKERSLKSILKTGLELFSKNDYDTEEKEFICDTFSTLAKIVGVDFASTLNKWLYGSLLSSLFKIGRILNPGKIIHTLQQPCVKCETELELTLKKLKRVFRIQTGLL